MSLYEVKKTILITCPKEIPPYLKEEVIALGLPVCSERFAAIETEGTFEDAIRLNLHIRTGHSVLYPLEQFKSRNADELYARISQIPWEDYIRTDGYISVTSSVNNPTINDSRYANMKCKDAIVDRFQKKYGKRPDSGPARTGTVIFLYWVQDQCIVYFDTSGEPLQRRGYRKISLKAPMQETLAAATILATHWDGEGNFVNPMCGSGTLAIEAALIALKRPPGLLRRNFGFMHLKEFNNSLWKKLRSEARKDILKTPPGKIIATDISKNAVEAARNNAQLAGVDHLIEFGVCDFSKTPIPPGGGIVFLNPEYGERLGNVEKLKETYKGIGDYFKQKCQGYLGYIFTGNMELAKQVGLRTKRRIPFYNATIECRLLEYELYQGTKKGSKVET